MKRLWSPWRSQHVARMAASAGDPAQGPSIFSTLAADHRDEDHFIVWRGRLVFVVMNKYPYNNGHLLIVPFREVQQYEELTAEEQIETAHTIERCIRWLRHALNPEGFNVGMNLGRAAGAGIPTHLHVHVVPRWQGDTNFMPTLAEVRVVPESMRDTYNKLCAAVRATARPQDEKNP